MAFRLLKKLATLKPTKDPHFYLSICTFSCTPTQLLLVNKGNNSPSLNNGVYNLSPLFPDGGKTDFKIELVDSDTWNVSSGLADVWHGRTSNSNSSSNASLKRVLESKNGLSEDEEEEGGNRVVHYIPPGEEDPDFDEIEDMRIHGNLFYKLDKNSKEYEEHKFDFHRKKSSNKKNHEKEEKAKKKENARPKLPYGIEKGLKCEGEGKDIKKKEKLCSRSGLGLERLSVVDKKSHLMSQLHVLEDHEKKGKSSLIHSGSGEEMFSIADKRVDLISRLHGLESYDGKKQRTPTFNQLTAVYHEPFCLDIFVSKGSVSASIIHRATSNVVAVAHSISKDIKFDLGSPKSRNACAMVGKVLAQRALDDDIHNAVYTPRKGEKLEGKLHIVLQAIIDGGVNVKVKLKQRKVKKTGLLLLGGQQKH